MFTLFSVFFVMNNTFLSINDCFSGSEINKKSKKERKKMLEKPYIKKKNWQLAFSLKIEMSSLAWLGTFIGRLGSAQLQKFQLKLSTSIRIYQSFFFHFLEHLHVMSLFYPHSLGFWKTKIEPVFAVRPVFLSRLDCIVTKCSCSHDIVIIMIIGWFHLACLLSYLLWKYRGFAKIMVFWF